jgi:hypothetical protein
MFKPPASISVLLFLVCVLNAALVAAADDDRLRLIVETDAGGDPDDEQSLVRLLVYANDLDIVGIIANRPNARPGENINPIRDGLGIVEQLVRGYGACAANLRVHDPRFPTEETLLQRTVAGYSDTNDGVDLIVREVDAADPRPLWFSNWGTDRGSAPSNLERALDQILRERGPAGYARFKNRLHLCSADRFADHTATILPPFPIWVLATQPESDGQRWYHRFSALTATAGGFDIERDVIHGHGALGALYPTNTGLKQKEGDSLYLLYLLPTGMNDPMQPAWGSWGGRYGRRTEFPSKPYFWANAKDAWRGRTNRDNTLTRWASALQNDFAARLDWCIASRYADANHRPQAILNGDASQQIVTLSAKPGSTVSFSAEHSSDPDGHPFECRWFIYPEAGTFTGDVPIRIDDDRRASLTVPQGNDDDTIHLILELRDHGQPPLCAYRRAIISIRR